jgi:hypothetical protein
MNRKNFLKIVGAGSLDSALTPLSLLPDKIPVSDIKESEKKAEIVLHFEDGKCLRFNDGMISSKDGLVITDPNILDKLYDIWENVKSWNEDVSDLDNFFKNYNSIVNKANEVVIETGATYMTVFSNIENPNIYYFNPSHSTPIGNDLKIF